MMLHLIAAGRSWRLLIRIGIATIAVAIGTALQLPVEIEVPGEPFLVYFIAVALTSIFLGRAAGFFTAGATTMASVMWFQPVLSFKLYHAIDLLTVEAYGIAATASVEGLCRLVDNALAERSEASSQRFQRHEAERRLTATERMTRSLAESEARFRATFENAAVGIAHVTLDGRWLRVNNAMSRILGWPADELVSKSFPDITHPDDLDVELVLLEQLRDGKVESYSVDKRYMRKDNTVVWTRRTVSCVRNSDGSIDYLVGVVEDISARKHAEEQVHLLMREARHRTKNIISLVQAIARQTAAGAPERFVERFTDRLDALAANQELLVGNEWQGVELEHLLRGQLAPFVDLLGTRIRWAGPTLRLNAAAAQAIGLALHELATNAGKYGALSTDAGRVGVNWQLEDDNFVMSWTEHHGPPVRPPEHRGFGSTVMESMVKQALGGDVRLDYAPSGLEWRLTCHAADALEGGADSRKLSAT